MVRQMNMNIILTNVKLSKQVINVIDMKSSKEYESYISEIMQNTNF